MPGVLAWIEQRLSRLAALIAAVVPVLLLIIWGGAYLAQVLGALQAPGRPVQFQYAAQGGLATLRAESYAMDLMRQRVYVRRVRLSGPDGAPVARVERATVSLAGPSIRVEATDAWVKIVRDPEKRLSIELALPVPEPGREPRPLKVELTRSRIEYHDLSQGPALFASGRVDHASIAMHGDAIVGAGSLHLEGAGNASWRIQSGAGGLWSARLSTSGLDLAPAAEHAGRWTDVEALRPYWPPRGARLRVAGGVELAGGPGEPVRALGEARLSGEGLALPYVADAARLDASFRFLESGAHGRISLREPGREASFDGSISWAGGFRGGGRLRAQARGENDLWPALRDLGLGDVAVRDVRYAGWIGWAGGSVRTGGSLRAEVLRLFGEQVGRPELALALSDEGLRARLDRGTWRGARVEGVASIAFDSGRIDGFLQSGTVDLAPIARRFGLAELRGRGAFTTVLRGTMQRPELVVESTGAATWARDGAPPRYLGLYRARGTVRSDGIDVARVAVRGPGGGLYAKGTIGFGARGIDLSGAAGGVDLSAWFPEVEGSGMAAFRVTGPVDDPKLAANAQVAGAEIGGRLLPVVSGQLTVDRHGVAVESANAYLGAAQVTARGTYSFADGRIDATWSVTDADLADWTGGGVSGIVQLTDGHVRGTRGRYQVSASVAGGDLEAGGAPITDLAGTLALDGDLVSVDLRASAAGGTVAVRGSGDLGGERLDAEAEVAGLSAARLPGLPQGVSASGRIDGSGRLERSNGITRAAMVDVRLRDVTVNGAPCGSGALIASAAEGVWSGGIELGHLTQFISLSGLSYNERTREISGRLDALNVGVAEILAAFQAQAAAEDETLRRLIAGAAGAATMSATLAGSVDSPVVEASTLTVDALRIGDREAGRIEAAATYRGGDVLIDRVDWTHGDARVIVSGRVDREMQAHLDAEIDNLDLSWLGLGAMDPPAIPGVLGASLVITGPLRDPALRGAARAELAGQAGSAQVVLDTFELAGGELLASGVFYAEGVTGPVRAEGPVAALAVGSDETRPLVFRADTSRPVSELRPLREALGDGLAGLLAGSVEAIVTQGALELAGDLALRDGRLPIPGRDEALEAASIDVRFARDVATVEGAATYSRGGTALLEARLRPGNPLERGQTLERLLASTLIEGTVQARGLDLDVRLGTPGERLRAVADVDVTLDGTLRTPVIGGQAAMRQVDAVMPAVLPAGAQPRLAFAPVFDGFRVVTAAPARIRSGGADVRVAGEATIDGPIGQLTVTAPLVLTEGDIDLPTARIALEPLGALRLTYSGGVARLDVDLEGRTAVSALRGGDFVQRYDVYLNVRGNMLETGGLTLSARSEPPELTSAEILALLGQREAFERIAFGGGRPGQDPLRDALLIVAAPMLTAALTDPLARALGLEYLNIDYNPIEQATVTAARTLARGLTLQARRQLFDPLIGRPRFEARLIYRLPAGRGILARTRLSLGFDQGRPWRLAIEYSTRF
jgi:hypothetical protein